MKNIQKSEVQITWNYKKSSDRSNLTGDAIYYSLLIWCYCDFIYDLIL